MLGILFDDTAPHVKCDRYMLCMEICVSFPTSRAYTGLLPKNEGPSKPPAQTLISIFKHNSCCKTKIEKQHNLCRILNFAPIHETYLSATTLEDLDEGRDGPSILEQGLEGHLGLADGVGIRMGEGGEELGQLSGRIGRRHIVYLLE